MAHPRTFTLLARVVFALALVLGVLSPGLAQTTLAAPRLTGPCVPRPVHLSWDAVPGATSYNVQVATAEGFGTTVATAEGLATTAYDVPGLQPATRYFWRVCAVNTPAAGAAVVGPWSAVWTFTTAPEPPPAATTLIAPANLAVGVPRPVHFTWNAAAGAYGYVFQVATSDAFGATIVNAQNVTNPAADSAVLLAGTKYFWRVQVVVKDAAGNAVYGLWSPVWSFTTVNPAPTAPTLTAPANGATGVVRPVHLAWNAVANASGYIAQIATTNAFTTPVTLNVATNAADVQGLLANTQYFWRVATVVKDATAGTVSYSGWSTVWNFITAAEAPVIAAPVLATPATGATGVVRPVHLTWNAVANVLGYAVQVSTTDAFVAPLAGAANVSITSADIQGLVANTKYFWRVQAVVKDAAGNYTYGPWSTVWSFTTAADVPVVPTPVLTAPVNLAVNIPNPAHFTWNAVANATGYLIQVATTDAFTTPVAAVKTVATNSADIAGLAPNTKYFWRVQAQVTNATTNITQYSAWSTVWSFTTAAPPPPPAAPTLVGPPNLAVGVPRPVKFTWNAVANAYGYTVQIATADAFGAAVVTAINTNTTSADAALLPGTKYFWRVQTVVKDAAGVATVSDWSTVRSFTTANTAPTAPTLVAPANSATGVVRPAHLTWNTVTGATGYIVQVATAYTFAAPATVITLNVATNAADVQGLLANTQYFWRVATVVKDAAAGTVSYSVWSPIWAFTTAAEIPPPVALAAPVLSTPTNLAGAVVVPTQLSWGAVTGALGYEVQIASVDTFTTLFANPTTSLTSTTVQALSAGTKYFWRVRAAAKDANNTTYFGPWSAVWNFTTVTGGAIGLN